MIAEAYFDVPDHRIVRVFKGRPSTLAFDIPLEHPTIESADIALASRGLLRKSKWTGLATNKDWSDNYPLGRLGAKSRVEYK